MARRPSPFSITQTRPPLRQPHSYFSRPFPLNNPQRMPHGQSPQVQTQAGTTSPRSLWTTKTMHPIKAVMDQASRGQFSKHLQRNTTARAVTQSLSWDVLDNPLNGAADKRQKA